MSARLPEPVVHDAMLRFAVTAPVTIRPQRADDGDLLAEFVRGLSRSARYQRFHAAVNDLPGPMLDPLTRIAPPREAALLATIGRGAREIVVGEARYGAADDAASDAREFALVVGDAWQRFGIGARLLGQLMRRATVFGVRRLFGDAFAANAPLLLLARRLAFTQRRHPTDARLVRVERTLDDVDFTLEVPS
jgi:acetyltransferase